MHSAMTVGKSKSVLNRFFAPRPTHRLVQMTGSRWPEVCSYNILSLEQYVTVKIMRTAHGKIMNYASTHHLIRARENRSTNVQNTIMLDARYLNLEKKTPQ
jgi:hypothetical protein